MEFPKTYQSLSQNEFSQGEVKIVPIRYEDRESIRQWRNDQIEFLRQDQPLSEGDQDQYFKTIVSTLFEQDNPKQYLFSYFRGNDFIGYGGLVHIDYDLLTAEISFLLNPQIQGEEFVREWTEYLALVEVLAFEEIGLKKIFTYAYDLRPLLYQALSNAGFSQEKRLINHHETADGMVDVLIHSKIMNPLSLREANSEDVMKVFEWSNDPLVRSQSYAQEEINLDSHKGWYANMLENEKAKIWIGVKNDQDVGLVRIAEKDDETVIGVLVAADHRGNGFAAELIKLGSQKWGRGGTIHAYIKKENKASVVAFERAGYQLADEVDVQGSPSFLYTFDKD